MITTTTIPGNTAAPAGQLPAAPAFDARAAAEGWNGYGRRAMLYALQLPAPCFVELDNDALAAGADACNVAMATPGTSDTTIACLAALQRELRARLAGRRAETARRVAGLQASHDRVFGAAASRPAAAPAAEVPPAAGPSGGTKVPKPGKPRGPVPPAQLVQLPAFDLSDAF
jgi:hypothetical protein